MPFLNKQCDQSNLDFNSVSILPLYKGNPGTIAISIGLTNSALCNNFRGVGPRKKQDGNKSIQKQKIIIEQQKILVDEAYAQLEEKNAEVIDSIHYAKRIQTALMPNEKYIEKTLNGLMKK